MKLIYTLVVLFLTVVTALIVPQTVDAKISASSAALTMTDEFKLKADDNRAKILRAYLQRRNSPLADHAETFIEEADKNGLDWKFVAAIAGLESSFGLHIPQNSYNGWGYGVYGNNVRRFESWDDGIAVVSTALREDYMEKWGATTVPEIGKIYASSPTWAQRVQFFMNDIEKFEKGNKPSLTISL
jgi:hypothetical protein